MFKIPIKKLLNALILKINVKKKLFYSRLLVDEFANNDKIKRLKK